MGSILHVRIPRTPRSTRGSIHLHILEKKLNFIIKSPSLGVSAITDFLGVEKSKALSTS